MSITFFVEGLPKGQPRPRAFAFHGHVRVYDPGTAEGWKAQVASAWKEATRNAEFTTTDGPVDVMLAFYMPRPKSHYNKSGLKPNSPHQFSKKPDCDNLAKSVLDAMTQLGVWKDDDQVCALRVWKRYVNSQKPVEFLAAAPKDREFTLDEHRAGAWISVSTL